MDILSVGTEVCSDMDMQSVGRKIREIRLSQGLTQEQLAEKAEISPTHVSVIERGLKSPQLDTFVSICNALDASADDVLSGVLIASTSKAVSELNNILHGQPIPVQQTVLRVAKAIIDEGE